MRSIPSLRWDTVIGANVLPLHADGTIDRGSLECHLDALVGSGIDVVFVNAVTGEGPLMTAAEREEVLSLAVGTVGERAAIGACLHPTSTEDAVRAAATMRDQGAAAILVFPHPEFAGRPTDATAPVGYVEAIHRASGLPLAIYQTTQDSGMQFTPTVLAEVAAVEGVAAIKEGSWNLADYHRTFERFGGDRSPAAVLADGDTLLGAMLRLGADGVMSGGTATVASRLVQAVCRSADQGRAAGDAARLERLTDALYRAPFGDFRARAKTILAARGEIATPTTRAPIPPIGDAEAGQLVDLARSLDLTGGDRS